MNHIRHGSCLKFKKSFSKASLKKKFLKQENINTPIRYVIDRKNIPESIQPAILKRHHQNTIFRLVASLRKLFEWKHSSKMM